MAKPLEDRLRAGSLAVLVFLGSLLLILLVLAEALTAYFGFLHHDASASDSAGWALVVLSPMLIPVLLYVAGCFARRTYRRVMDKAYAG